MDTPMSHSEYEELAAGYVLGALEPDDEHVFQQHLSGCPVCEANVCELEAVTGELAYAAPPVEPPATLWAGIQREIRPEAARRPAVPAVPAAGPGGRRLRLLPALAAAAAILAVVVLSLWNLNLRDQNALYRDRVAALEQAAQLANDPTASLVRLDDGAGAAGAQATVIASTRQDRGVLLVQNLPPLQRNRVYELWGVPGGVIAQAEKAVVFVPLRRQGTQALEFSVPIQPGTVFAITEEPGPDGSAKPTSEPLLVGAPRTA
ncbi:MAG: anti-sigma factor domain-containing protein [Actinomycetes bacterium]